MISGVPVPEAVLEVNTSIASGDQEMDVAVTLSSLNASSMYTVKVSACTAVGCAVYTHANPSDFTTDKTGKHFFSVESYFLDSFSCNEERVPGFFSRLRIRTFPVPEIGKKPEIVVAKKHTIRPRDEHAQLTSWFRRLDMV